MSNRWNKKRGYKNDVQSYSFSENPEHEFDENLFLDTLRLTKRNKDRIIELRKKITRQTLNNIIKQFYITSDGKRVELDEDDLYKDVVNTLHHTEKNLMDKARDEYFEEVKISIVQRDHLEVAEELVKKGLNPIVVLGVHPVEPGGTFLKDGKLYSDGLEEDSFRRTTLHNAICDPHQLLFKRKTKDREWEYKIPEFGGLYSSDSFIFRKSEEHGYAYLKEPVKMSFLLQIPLKRMKVQTLKKKRFKVFDANYKHFFDDLMLNQVSEDKLMKKLKVLFEIICRYNHDSVVFASGFTTISSPPFAVAVAMRRVIQNKFKNKFKEIVFPILDKNVLENSNFKFQVFGHYLPFRHAFFPEEEMEPVMMETRNQKFWNSVPQLDGDSSSSSSGGGSYRRWKKWDGKGWSGQGGGGWSGGWNNNKNRKDDYHRYKGYGKPSSSSSSSSSSSRGFGSQKWGSNSKWSYGSNSGRGSWVENSRRKRNQLGWLDDMSDLQKKKTSPPKNSSSSSSSSRYSRNDSNNSNNKDNSNWRNNDHNHNNNYNNRERNSNSKTSQGYSTSSSSSRTYTNTHNERIKTPKRRIIEEEELITPKQQKQERRRRSGDGGGYRNTTTTTMEQQESPKHMSRTRPVSRTEKSNKMMMMKKKKKKKKVITEEMIRKQPLYVRSLLLKEEELEETRILKQRSKEMKECLKRHDVIIKRLRETFDPKRIQDMVFRDDGPQHRTKDEEGDDEVEE